MIPQFLSLHYLSCLLIRNETKLIKKWLGNGPGLTVFLSNLVILVKMLNFSEIMFLQIRRLKFSFWDLKFGDINFKWIRIFWGDYFCVQDFPVGPSSHSGSTCYPQSCHELFIPLFSPIWIIVSFPLHLSKYQLSPKFNVEFFSFEVQYPLTSWVRLSLLEQGVSYHGLITNLKESICNGKVSNLTG